MCNTVVLSSPPYPLVGCQLPVMFWVLFSVQTFLIISSPLVLAWKASSSSVFTENYVEDWKFWWTLQHQASIPTGQNLFLMSFLCTFRHWKMMDTMLMNMSLRPVLWATLPSRAAVSKGYVNTKGKGYYQREIWEDLTRRWEKVCLNMIIWVERGLFNCGHPCGMNS